MLRRFLYFRGPRSQVYQSVYFKQIQFNGFNCFAFDAEISQTLTTTYWLKTMAILKVKVHE